MGEGRDSCFRKFWFSPYSNLELNNPDANPDGESLNFVLKSRVLLMSVYPHSVQMGLEAGQLY